MQFATVSSTFQSPQSHSGDGQSISVRQHHQQPQIRCGQCLPTTVICAQAAECLVCVCPDVSVWVKTFFTFFTTSSRANWFELIAFCSVCFPIPTQTDAHHTTTGRQSERRRGRASGQWTNKQATAKRADKREQWTHIQPVKTKTMKTTAIDDAATESPAKATTKTQSKCWWWWWWWETAQGLTRSRLDKAANWHWLC